MNGNYNLSLQEPSNIKKWLQIFWINDIVVLEGLQSGFVKKLTYKPLEPS